MTRWLIAHIEFAAGMGGALVALITYMRWAAWRKYQVGRWFVALNTIVLVWYVAGLVTTSNPNPPIWRLVFYGLVALLLMWEAVVFAQTMRQARSDAAENRCSECGQVKPR